MTYDLGGNASTSDVGDSISQICKESLISHYSVD